MTEVWLRSNRRAVSWGFFLPAVLAVLGVLLIQVGASRAAMAATMGGWAAVGLAGTLVGLLLWQLRQPRIAYANGEMLVYLRFGRPLRVPVDAVEAFLMGQGPARLPSGGSRAETKTVVVRIAEAATDYARVDVQPALGSWCDGYITVRGTWCEPIDVRLLERLNRRLGEAHAELRQHG